MNARETIIGRVRLARTQSGLTPRAHPGLFAAPAFTDNVARFADVAAAGGTRVVRGVRGALAGVAHEGMPSDAAILSTVREIPGTRPVESPPHQLADLDLCVVEGQLGVAESGAIWLPMPESGPRAALYLAQHVLLVLRADRIVGTMHEAYATVDVSASRFGCFVAGPSKTADIEQSLVIGAHGPTGLTVALVD